VTADVRRTPRRGTSSACAVKAHALARDERSSPARTRPSLGPSTRARRSSLCTERRKALSWWGVRIGITVGQTHASGRNQHWGRTDGRSRLAACHRSREGEGVARQKRKEVEASVPARIVRARVWLPARRIFVAEVGRRRRTSNKLGKRAPKRAAVSSEQGPSSERRSAGETVDRHLERRARRESGSPVTREGTGRRLRVTRDRHPAGAHIAKSGAAFVGPGL